jgi:alpha-1,6-mannosyltransferase
VNENHLHVIAPTTEPRLYAARDEARFVDTTMLYAPQSGGVKRYLTAKRAWLAQHRPLVDHHLVVPGAAEVNDGEGVWSVYTIVPFAHGYRLPTSNSAWKRRLTSLKPDLIEAGDPFTPGMAAIRAGQELGCPVVGFCHTDLGALAALHIGEWAEKPTRRKWAKVYSRFDHVLACSRYMAGRLLDEGVPRVTAMPLGVDTDVFRPFDDARAWLRAELGLPASARLLVFAGRPAREKRIEVLVEAVERLGEPYVLLLIGAGDRADASSQVMTWPYQSSAANLARVLAGCDAFVHANSSEPFGLVVLEAMACGLPVVGVPVGGVAESIDEGVGQVAADVDATAMAEAIEGLVARDVEALGQAARARAVERHGWHAVFTRLTGLYGEFSGLGAFGGVSPIRAVA